MHSNTHTHANGRQLPRNETYAHTRHGTQQFTSYSSHSKSSLAVVMRDSYGGTSLWRKGGQHRHRYSECSHKHLQTYFFLLSDNNTIQFQGTKHSATTWLLIIAKVSAGWAQINLLLEIRVVTEVPLGLLSQISTLLRHVFSWFECKLRYHLFGIT